MIYEPTVIATWLQEVFTDAALLAFLPGGAFESDASGESEGAGVTATRRETPYLVFHQLAGAGDIQGAGGTILVGDLDYAAQVLYRPSETETARSALARVQALLEGAEEAVEGDEPYNLVARGRGVLPRLSHRETGGRLTYSEGRRWRIRVQRAE